MFQLRPRHWIIVSAQDTDGIQKQLTEVFLQKGVLKNFAKFTGKHLCQCHFFNKVIKKETLAQVFPCEFYEISKNAFFTEHLRTTTSRFCWASLTILEIFLKYSPRSDMM